MVKGKRSCIQSQILCSLTPGKTISCDKKLVGVVLIGLWLDARLFPGSAPGIFSYKKPCCLVNIFNSNIVFQTGTKNIVINILLHVRDSQEKSPAA